MLKRVDSIPGITVRLQGGLGNQLFIYACGIQQSRRLDCPLYLDLSLFSNKSNNRELEIRPLVNVLGGEFIELPNSNSHNFATRVINRLHSPSIFREKHPLTFDPNVNKIQPGTILEGYFQSHKYFTEIAAELYKGLCLGNSKSNENTLHLHVRRGDYLNKETADFHGLAGIQYFEKGNKILQKISDIHQTVIFSDSISLVEKEFEQMNFTRASFRRQETLSPLEALIEMSNSGNFILSNSSFSWWSAWISRQRGEQFVIAPRPWFRDGSSAKDLLFNDWITLGLD